jgi:hypothetical protein
MMDSLPDIQLVEQKMTNFVTTSNDELYDRISVTFKNIDARIVSMRKEFDVDSILKLITRKADGEQVNSDLKNHEFKISLLDKNLIHIASDF